MKITSFAFAASLLLIPTKALNTLCNPSSGNSSSILSTAIAKRYVTQFCTNVQPRTNTPDQLPLPTIHNTNMDGSGNIELSFTQYDTSKGCTACLASYNLLFGECGVDDKLKGNGTIDSKCGNFTFEILKSVETSTSSGANPTETNGGVSGRQRILGGGVLLAGMAGVFSLL